MDDDLEAFWLSPDSGHPFPGRWVIASGVARSPHWDKVRNENFVTTFLFRATDARSSIFDAVSPERSKKMDALLNALEKDSSQLRSAAKDTPERLLWTWLSLGDLRLGGRELQDRYLKAFLYDGKTGEDLV